VSERADALVLFGISGDLAKKKLFPALYELQHDGRLDVPVIGVALSDWDDESLRSHARESLREAGVAVDEAVLSKLAAELHYVRGDYRDAALYGSIREALGGARLPVFYLAIPPSLFDDVVEGLGGACLSRNARVVLEKPFGRDLASAQALNRVLHQRFPESAIFRIDHFLGKEPVQNMMVFRFANTFEPIWNRNYIESVQVTMAEAFGIEGRGAFYDSVGTLKDVVQNHLLQIVAMLAMEPPVSTDPDAVRDEKVKVLKSICPLRPQDLVRGQYAGYRDEPGVAPDSDTETFVALRLEIDTWRWAGVPWVLRAGKAMPATVTEAVIEFKAPPQLLFDDPRDGAPDPNRVRFRLKPDETITLHVQAKRPGEGFVSGPVDLEVAYESKLGGEEREAYDRLIGDAMKGDQSLFGRQDAVEAAWRVVDPVLTDRPPAHSYARGTWGPAEASRLLPPQSDWAACSIAELEHAGA
jgi:glucose-6-phosphate 1-dehydrogenase